MKQREKPMSSLRSFLSRALGWLIAIIVSLCWAIPIAWATLAIYYSNLPWAGMRLALAAAFAAFTIWAIWFSGRRRMSAMAIVLFRVFSRLGRMVVPHPPLARSQLATGSRGDAASRRRRRPRAPDRCPQLRLPHPE